MTPLRTLIADDEPIACQALCRMLSQFEEIEVCGQAESIHQAATLAREERIDVIYLDIELFGENGFDLIPMLDSDIAVIFVTAFNQYAIRAFEVNALDYLLKPVTRERLAETIRRLCHRTAPPPESTGVRNLRITDKVLVKDNKRRRLLELKKVYSIEADGDFTVLRSIDGQKGMIWRGLREWEDVLPAETFIRIHRGLILNLDCIVSFETISGNRLRIYCKGAPEPLHASRRMTPILRKQILSRSPLPDK